MASHAYVLINVEMGNERSVLEQLRNIENVKEGWIVYGIYDIVVKVTAERTEQLKEVISEKIRKIDGVRNTLTLIPIEGFP
ncbi:MAG: Lrp/AsnC ligand binding domain-containing protein [Thermoproteota archaeon]